MKGEMMTQTAIVLTLAALLSVAFISSATDGADDGFSVHSESARTTGGGTVDLSIWAEGLSGAAILTVNVAYDADALMLEKATPLCDLKMTENYSKAGEYSVSIESKSTYGFSRMITGELFELCFHVSEDAAEGQHPVFISTDAVGGARPVNYGSMVTVGKLPGDLSGDGRISVLDALILKKHLEGVQTGLSSEDMDVDGNGKVDDADRQMMKRHLSGRDVGLSEPLRGTMLFKGQGFECRVAGTYAGYEVFLFGDLSGKEVLGDVNRTIEISKNGSFIVPRGGDCAVVDAEEAPAGKCRFICLSILQPDGISFRSDGKILNDYMIDAGGKSTTMVLTGASFVETENEGCFTASLPGGEVVLSCLTSAEAEYEIGDRSLTIRLKISGDLSDYFLMLFMDADADLGSGYVPSVGDRAKYNLKLTYLLPVADTDIGLKVVSVHEKQYAVELSGEIFDGKKPVVVFPSGVPITAVLKDVSLNPLKTEKVSGKACDVYEMSVPGVPSKLRIWVETSTDVLMKAKTTAEGVDIAVTLAEYDIRHMGRQGRARTRHPFIRNGCGRPMDGTEDIRKAILAADGGDCEAAAKLTGMANRDLEALDPEALAEMAQNGSQWAAVLLGRMKEWAIGTEHDDSAAARLYESAAKDGNAYAMAALGRLYERGEGVPKSLHHAYLLYSASSSRGCAAADEWLSRNKDRAERLEQTIRGSDAGDAECQYRLAKAYDDGCELEHSEKRAVDLYAKSADQGFAPAVYEIACRCEYGDGVPESMATAVNMHIALADSGFEPSQKRLMRLDKEELKAADMSELERMSASGSTWARLVAERLSEKDRTVFRAERQSAFRGQDRKIRRALRARRRDAVADRPADEVRRVRRLRRLPRGDRVRRVP